MPQARKLNDLKVAGNAAQIAAPSPVHLEPRELRSDRDIVLSLPPATASEAA